MCVVRYVISVLYISYPNQIKLTVSKHKKTHSCYQPEVTLSDKSQFKNIAVNCGYVSQIDCTVRITGSPTLFFVVINNATSSSAEIRSSDTSA